MLGLFWGYMGIMAKNMETAIMGYRIWGMDSSTFGRFRRHSHPNHRVKSPLQIGKTLQELPGLP